MNKLSHRLLKINSSLHQLRSQPLQASSNLPKKKKLKMLMKMELMKGKRVVHSLPIRLRSRRSPHLPEAISLTLLKNNLPLPVLKVKKVKPIKRQWISTRVEVRMTNGNSRLTNLRKTSNNSNNSIKRNRKLIRRLANNSPLSNNQLRLLKRLSLVTHHVSGS